MTTAQRIIAAHDATTFAGAQKLENEIRDMAVKTEGANCFDRVWTFYDGSAIRKTRDGYTA